jgi:hypothetical protein
MIQHDPTYTAYTNLQTNVAKELGHHRVVSHHWVPNAVTCITRIDGTNIPSADSDCKRRDTASSIIVLGYGFSGRQRAKKTRGDIQHGNVRSFADRLFPGRCL